MFEKDTAPVWRDPLSLGWQAHRGLLLLRLRWHASSSRRDERGVTTLLRPSRVLGRLPVRPVLRPRTRTTGHRPE
ncbi:hypothetical protein KEK_10328 [Mycolicibacterium thermoresistibile ATCC 19527]|uniref:Uncharacterized protein n=2 Tax=Mycolicibacterium thermoresistibile TaxID=1797 RepID=G7CI73_MYCT3|nr:hypothetical protein KEK_10328 [Mycolicibacterium thermoresistibile ATCC 19527]GAT14230.1 putative uncharacterized protein [Mycolicibacterium thermoresistibile]SNW20769.1 Uncharacterised protein [Mycolicibacterium thermoresistibile]